MVGTGASLWYTSNHCIIRNTKCWILSLRTWGPGFGFGYFNSLKIMCNYDEQKANKDFEQKFFFLVFKVW